MKISEVIAKLQEIEQHAKLAAIPEPEVWDRGDGGISSAIIEVVWSPAGDRVYLS